MRPVEIRHIDHHDDGSITVKYVDYRRETITDKTEITAICRVHREQKWVRENSPPKFPTLMI